MAFTSEFPGCCGIYVVQDFWHPVETERKVVQKAKSDFKHRSILVASLNNVQKHEYGPMLLEEGFRCVGSGHNRPHSSIVYLYVYIINPVKK